MDSQETNDIQDDDFGATKETSQTGSTSTKKTVTVDSSVIVVEETGGEENSGKTEQAGSSLESSGDSEKKQSKGQGHKKPKIRYAACQLVLFNVCFLNVGHAFEFYYEGFVLLQNCKCLL